MKIFDAELVLGPVARSGVIKRSELAVETEFWKLASDVTFEVKAQKTLDKVWITGLCTGTKNVVCSRCLSETEAGFHYSIDQMVNMDPLSMAIDVNEIVYETIVLNIGVRQLCRMDCKGLCPVCGSDLNAGDCGCM